MCRLIDFVAAWNLIRWRLAGSADLSGLCARKFLRQDQLTMIQQAEGLKYDPRLMLVDAGVRTGRRNGISG